MCGTCDIYLPIDRSIHLSIYVSMDIMETEMKMDQYRYTVYVYVHVLLLAMVVDMAISTRSCCAFSEDVVRKTINLSEDGAPPGKRVGERPTSATTSLRFLDMFSSPFLNPPARCCTTPAVVAFAVTFLLPKRYCDSYPACIGQHLFHPSGL